MSDISRFVSEDSRKPIERLRRYQLWREADARGIQYPPQAAKTTMIQILEANGVDVTRPVSESVRWSVINGTDSDGRPSREIYPVLPEHASARNGVNADAVVSQRLAAQEKAAEAKQKAVESENEELKAMLAKMQERLDALEGKKAESVDEVPTNYFQLVKYAQEKGFPATRKMKKADILAMLNGKNPT